MQRKLCTIISLIAVAAYSEWRPTAIDITAGYSAPAPSTAYAGAFHPASLTQTIGARDPVTLSWRVGATDTNALTVHLAAGPVYFRSFAPRTVVPTSDTNAVIALAVTSGVTITLGTFTNGSSPWTSGLWLAAGDEIQLKSTNSTAANPLLSLQTYRPNVTSDTPAFIRMVQPSALLPTNAVVTLSAVTSGVTVAALATFTGAAPAAWTNGLTTSPGDTVSLAVSGATNAVGVTVTSQSRIAYSNSVAEACRLVAAQAGAVLPASASSAVTLSAVTSGVSVALATFTNGAAPWTGSLLLAAGDAVVLTAAAVTNAAAVTLSIAQGNTASIATSQGTDAVRVSSLRLTGTALPTNAAAVLIYTPYLGDPTNLATLTDGPYQPAIPLVIYPGDTLSISAPDATNSVPARAHAERFQ